jgi:hypothetical protein
MAIGLGLAAIATLLVMVAVGMVTGASQEAHEWYGPPDAYAERLLAQAGAVRVIFGLDIAFLVLYTGFFAALADYLRRRGRPFVTLALGALLVTALLDIVEDHHILALLGVAEAHRPIDDGALVVQQVISSTKFSVSYLALVLFGLAVPRDTRLAWVLSIFLVGGTLVSGALGYAAPPAWRASLDGGRWIGFLAGFGLAVAWLRASSEEP